MNSHRIAPRWSIWQETLMVCSMFLFSLKFLMAKIAHFKRAKHHEHSLPATLFHLCSCSDAVSGPLQLNVSLAQKGERWEATKVPAPELYSSSLLHGLIPLLSQKGKQCNTAWRWRLHDRHINSYPVKGCNFAATIDLVIDEHICQIYIHIHIYTHAKFIKIFVTQQFYIKLDYFSTATLAWRDVTHIPSVV